VLRPGVRNSRCSPTPICTAADTSKWARQGYWVHIAKVAFERDFLRKVRRGRSEPFYERFVRKTLGIPKLKAARTPVAAQ